MRCPDQGDPLTLHIHIGPSPLAQSLILPLADAAGFHSYLVGRVDAEPLPTENGEHFYTLRWEGPEGCDEEKRTVCWCQPGSLQDLPAEVLRGLSEDGAVLITATLRNEGIEARAKLILEMLELRLDPRLSGAETVVMPCENKVPSQWRKIEDLCRAGGAIYLQPLVNRISVPVPDLEVGARETRTHRLGEWLVASPQRPSKVLDALSLNPQFDVVEDLEMRLKRKFSMVNGAHLAFGIVGRRQRRRSLSETARWPRNTYDVVRLHHVMEHGLNYVGCNLADTCGYGREHLAAYCEVDDQVSRIMASLKRADPRSFLEIVDERLSRPAALTANAQRSHDGEMRLGDWIAPYREIFNNLDHVLEKLSAYSDFNPKQRRGLRFDPTVDREAVALYEMSLRRWEQEGEVVNRVERLRRSLAMHRGAPNARG